MKYAASASAVSVSEMRLLLELTSVRVPAKDAESRRNVLETSSHQAVAERFKPLALGCCVGIEQKH